MPKPRRDGWTPERQEGFLDALGQTCNVARAAAAVGMSASTAYRLRARPEGEAFGQAWDMILDYTQSNLEARFIDLALNGWQQPVIHKGRIIGEQTVVSDKLMVALLRYLTRKRSTRPNAF